MTRSENCKCEARFTCGYCLDLCVARNLADRNAALLSEELNHDHPTDDNVLPDDPAGLQQAGGE